jgi:hypothetical protein
MSLLTPLLLPPVLPTLVPRHNDRWLVNRSAINGRLAVLFNAAAAIAVAGGAAAAGAYTCFGDSIYVRRGETETVVAQV